jgi:hypothetical protein
MTVVVTVAISALLLGYETVAKNAANDCRRGGRNRRPAPRSEHHPHDNICADVIA